MVVACLVNSRGVASDSLLASIIDVIGPLFPGGNNGVASYVLG